MTEEEARRRQAFDGMIQRETEAARQHLAGYATMEYHVGTDSYWLCFGGQRWEQLRTANNSALVGDPLRFLPHERLTISELWSYLNDFYGPQKRALMDAKRPVTATA